MSRLIKFVFSLVLIGVMVTLAVAWFALRASLPVLDGEVSLAGLEGPASIRRDATGVVTITADSRNDLAMATGFVHAQDRFFQMDLSRRKAAGELSELFGAVAVDVDKASRLHQFRRRAEAALADASEKDRALLEAYAAGVNQGLVSLAVRPFEYFLLGAEPAAWRAEDCLLILYSMFLLLNDTTGERESALALMDDTLPPELVDLIVPEGTPWDAPLVGEARAVPPLPSPEIVDLRTGGPIAVARLARLRGDESGIPGSNNWAVGGGVATNGRALVANDMHLPLGVPNVFYRLRLELTGDDGFTATGVSLPGQPVIVAGSNGKVAWGFTNSYGDWTDTVLLELDPEDPVRYRTADGFRPFEISDETIAVKGSEPVILTLRGTIWGPVVGEDHAGRLTAVKWLAHEPGAVNLGLMELERAADVDEAMDVAIRAGIPPQNIVMADSKGNIGWTIMGRIPRRNGYDATRPAYWTEAGTGWQGWLSPEEYPRVVNPASGRIWTANARVVDGEMLATVGDGGYALGGRAGQIRDDLLALDSPDVRDMLAVQLDDRASFYERWRRLALDSLAGDDSGDPVRVEFERLLREWSPRASVDSVGFRLVYEFRSRLLGQLYAALTAPVREIEPDFYLEEGLRYALGRQFEGAAWRLVTEQPAHLLNPAYESWQAQILGAIDATIDAMDGEGGLAARTWGEKNTARIRHPMSGAIPWAQRWLDMPAEPLDGATHMPRVQQADFGASERFGVSPGRESEGYFHMPAGQSGHPLSRFYRTGHEAWVTGEPTPFLPGEARHELRLKPL